VHHLGDLLDIELLSLSVDNGLDLLLLDGVDSLVDDNVLLDGLNDGGLSTDQRSSSLALDVSGLSTLEAVVDSVKVSVECGLSHHLSVAEASSTLKTVVDTVVVSVWSTGGGAAGQILQIDSTVVVSVQRVVVGTSDKSGLSDKSLVHHTGLSNKSLVEHTGLSDHLSVAKASSTLDTVVDTVVVSVWSSSGSAAGQILQIDSAVVVSVQRVHVGTSDHFLLVGEEGLLSNESSLGGAAGDVLEVNFAVVRKDDDYY